MSWRPKDWSKTREVFAEANGGDYELKVAALEDFEAGADAFLLSLESQKGYLEVDEQKVSFHIPDTTRCREYGRWVFIPNEEV